MQHKSSIPGDATNQRLLLRLGLYRFAGRRLGSIGEIVQLLPPLAANPQLFGVDYSMLDFAWQRAAPLDSMQRLLLLINTVLLDSGGNSRNLVRRVDDVRLGAGGGREVGGANNGSGLDGRVDVLDGSDGELRAGVRGGRLAGLLNGSGRSSGLGSRSRSVALLNGSAGSLVGSLLADVALVDGGLLGTTNVFLSQGHVLRGGGAGSLHSLVGVPGGNLAELLGLLVGNLGGVVEVGVDQLLVGDVDQRSEVDNGSGDEEETPLRSDLDKEVGNEGGEESLWIVSQCKRNLQ